MQLRGIAMNYLTQFVHTVETAIQDGNVVGLPSQTGKTLSEEWTSLFECGELIWGIPGKVPFNPEKWGIPAYSRPLYGRQQMERLLAEFRTVIEHAEIEPITDDEIAVAAGSISLSDSSTLTHAVTYANNLENLFKGVRCCPAEAA